MKLSDVDILCDPQTGEELTLQNAILEGGEVVSGFLQSPSNRYPIVFGIPRFVSDEGYSDNFGFQWNRWARIQFEDENVGRSMQGHTSAMFEAITGFSRHKLTGRTVLDLGCGPGRFTDVALHMGARVVAVDYSSAIDAAKKNFTDKSLDVLFIQADALKLPIKPNSLDYGFSIGVLHHTPSPQRGVNEVFRVIREGGSFAVRVYPATGFYTYFMVTFWRKIFVGLKPLFGHTPPLLYSYFFGTIGYLLGKIWRPLSYPLRAIFPTAWLPDLRWTILDTFDAIATTHQSGHDPKDVEGWLRHAGFSRIEHRGGNDFVGAK
jgi:SAM-dependent methyltransferase